MTFVRVMKVAIVQVVDVAAVAYGGVSTAWAVLVIVLGMGRGGARRHETASLPYLKAAWSRRAV